MADPKRKSLTTTGGAAAAPARAMLRAVGFRDEDFDRPIVGVANLHSDITPCNAHLDRLAHKAIEGVRTGGGGPPGLSRPPAPRPHSQGHPGAAGTRLPRART